MVLVPGSFLILVGLKDEQLSYRRNTAIQKNREDYPTTPISKIQMETMTRIFIF
jgi:hypothetical protein